IHCEKPLAPTAKEAAEMVQAAQAAGVVTQVGYNYIKNPLLKLAKQMIADGELGEIVSFRGIHAEDYMADPEIPYDWRGAGSGGSTAVAVAAPSPRSAAISSAWRGSWLDRSSSSVPI